MPPYCLSQVLLPLLKQIGAPERIAQYMLCVMFLGPEVGCAVCPSLALSQDVMDPMCQFLPFPNRKEKKITLKENSFFRVYLFVRKRAGECGKGGRERESSCRLPTELRVQSGAQSHDP